MRCIKFPRKMLNMTIFFFIVWMKNMSGPLDCAIQLFFKINNSKKIQQSFFRSNIMFGVIDSYQCS